MAIFGTVGIFVRAIPLPSASVAFFRGVMGLVFLLIVMALTGKKPNMQHIRGNLTVLLLSGAAIGANWILLFEAYRYTTVATATICYYLAPMFVVLASPLLWDRLAPYQKERLLVGFNPELDPMGKGMQPLLSKQCIGNGGILGIGLMGKGDYEILPASHTDFIFATICEKFGMVGGIFVIILLAIMVIRIFVIAKECGKDFGGLICVGVGAIIVVQTIENLGMCLAMLPVVGITLPFLSCGGSSVLATYVLLSLVHSVSSHRSKMRENSFDETKRR